MPTTYGTSGNLADAAITIAGRGHVYTADVDAPTPDVTSYKFNGGADITVDTKKFTWLGDTSSENMIEFETDGGDVNVKRTWDREAVRGVKESVTNTLTIQSVNLSGRALAVAFPGSQMDPTTKYYGLEPGSESEKAVLIVVEDGDLASAFYFPRVQLSGSLPKLQLDEFAEMEIKGTLLKPVSGAAQVQYRPPFKVTK